MKILSTIAVICMLATNSCEGQESNLEKATYVSQTRGGVKKIEVTEKEILFGSNGKQWSAPLSKDDWTQLIAIINNIELNDFESYASKASDRSRDAAWHSSIMLHVSDEEYESQTFDDQMAPKQLDELMQFFIKMDRKLNTAGQRLF